MRGGTSGPTRVCNWLRYDPLFFLHHVAVMGFLVSSLLTKAAGLTCIMGLAMGEITNVFQNGCAAVAVDHVATR